MPANPSEQLVLSPSWPVRPSPPGLPLCSLERSLLRLPLSLPPPGEPTSPLPMSFPRAPKLFSPRYEIQFFFTLVLNYRTPLTGPISLTCSLEAGSSCRPLAELLSSPSSLLRVLSSTVCTNSHFVQIAAPLTFFPVHSDLHPK